MKRLKNIDVPVEISNRHIHLSKADLEKLFGKGYALNKLKDLSQFGQFAAKETISIKNKDKIIENVRILGPVRKDTQVEISKTDARFLKLDAPVRESGDLKDTPGITLINNKDNIKINLKDGVIISKRHIHMPKDISKKLNIKDKDKINIKTKGECSVIFTDVLVRCDKKFNLAVHLDTDEGNAARIDGSGIGNIII